MLQLLIVLSAYSQVAWACLAMDPGDYMVCPSVPQATALQGYLSSTFTKENKNGDLVYTCTAVSPYDVKLFSVDGGSTPTELNAKSTLRCNANSGKFVLVDEQGKSTEIGSKKFACGYKVPCPVNFLRIEPPLPGFKLDTEFGTQIDLWVSKAENGGTVYTCKPATPKYIPVAIISKENTIGKELAEGSSLVCKENSGKFVVKEGSGPETEIDNKSFGCGFDCTSCNANTSPLFESTSAECSSRSSVIMCTSMPTMSTYKDCKTLTCADNNKLFLLLSDITNPYITIAADNLCSSGQWEFSRSYAVASPTPILGYACGIVL